MITVSFSRLTALSDAELDQELNRWTREDFIQFLTWNDSNGIYTDEDSLKELGNIMTREEGYEIAFRQISESRG